MPIYELNGKKPAISQDAFVHPDAILIGDVTIGDGCMIAPGAVLRADIGTISIGTGTSIQDNAVIHANPGVRVIIEDHVVIAHGAILHDVHIHSGCVIGMGATLLFNIVCEQNVFVAAGSVVKNNTHIPAGKLAAGNPAIIIRDVTPEQLLEAKLGAEFYVELGKQYKAGMKRVG